MQGLSRLSDGLPPFLIHGFRGKFSSCDVFCNIVAFKCSRVLLPSFRGGGSIYGELHQDRGKLHRGLFKKLGNDKAYGAAMDGSVPGVRVLPAPGFHGPDLSAAVVTIGSDGALVQTLGERSSV